MQKNSVWKNRFVPVAETLESRVNPMTFGTWLDTTGDHNWYTPANWAGGAVPGSPDGPYGAIFNVHSPDDCELSGTEGSGEYRPAFISTDSNWTHTLYMTGLVYTGSLTMGGGTIDNHGATMSVGGLTWTAGDITGGNSALMGNLDITGNGTISTTTQAKCGDKIHMDTASTTLTIGAGASLKFQAGAGIEINNTNTYLYTTSFTFADDVGSAGNITLSNGGLWDCKAGSPGAVNVGNSDLSLNNLEGSFDVESYNTINFNKAVLTDSHGGSDSLLSIASGVVGGNVMGVFIQDYGKIGFTDWFYSKGTLETYRSSSTPLNPNFSDSANITSLDGEGAVLIDGGDVWIAGTTPDKIGVLEIDNCPLYMEHGLLHIKIWEGSGTAPNPPRGTADIIFVHDANIFIDTLTGYANDMAVIFTTAGLVGRVGNNQTSTFLQSKTNHANNISGTFAYSTLVTNDGFGDSWQTPYNDGFGDYVVTTPFLWP